MGNKRGPATAKGSNKKAQQRQPQKKGGGVLAGPRRFTKDVRGELRRVSWPDRDQLRQSTAVVLIIVIVLAIYVAAVDFVFQSLVRLIFL
jgi:preprotein translocase subunit SecE